MIINLLLYVMNVSQMCIILSLESMIIKDLFISVFIFLLLIYKTNMLFSNCFMFSNIFYNK